MNSLCDGTLPAIVRQIARGASIEITPNETARISSLPSLLAPGTRVFLTHISGASIESSITAAARLKSQGMKPVVHIAARRLRSREELQNLAEALRKVGCCEALIIAGSDRNPIGSFASSLDLLDTGVLERAGFDRIGVAGHPEGNPDVSDDLLWTALQQKNEYAKSSTARFHIVTQFCFDSQAVIRWERAARERGNLLPVHIGIPGLTSVSKLLKFAALCGVGASVRFLRGGSRGMLRLPRWQPDEFIASIARSRRGDNASLIDNLHFFPFGSICETVDFIHGILS